MKKNFIIRNIVLIIVLLVIISVGIYSLIKKNARNYEIAKVEHYNYFVLKQDNLSGIIDRSGNIIIDVQYDDIKIPNPEKAIFICYQGDNTKVLNEKNEEIISSYDKVEPIALKNIASDLMYEKSVLKYQENGKYGIINFQGKKITKPIYDEIEGLAYKEGELLVKKEDKYGVINIKGNKLINIEYDKISADGYYTDENKYKYAGYIVSNKTEEGYRFGYITYKGKVLLKPKYNELIRVNEIEDNENIYIIQAENGQYGVTKNDKQIINNEYQSVIYDTTNKLFVIEKSKKYGISNLEGKIIVPTNYKQINITGIYLYAENDQGTTVYNNDGTEAKIDKNIAILNTSNEKYKIRINSENGTKYGVIGKDGKQIIEEKYNYIEYLYDNYFIVSGEESKLGVIDNKENIKIEIENDSIQKVGNTDILQVSSENGQLIKLYKRDMTKIVEMKKANVEEKEQIIKIYNNEEQKYFNTDGNELSNKDVYKNNKLFSIKKNDKWGFVDKDDNIIVKCEYDKVTEFNEYGFAGVQKDKKWGIINSEGKQVVKPKYELSEEIEPFFIGHYYRVKYGFGEFYFTEK